jgi:hypothetical protein
VGSFEDSSNGKYRYFGQPAQMYWPRKYPREEPQDRASKQQGLPYVEIFDATSNPCNKQTAEKIFDLHHMVSGFKYGAVGMHMKSWNGLPTSGTTSNENMLPT